MKKLTAGIFATLLAVVSAGDANAKIASQAYVDQEVGAVEATVTEVQQNVTNVTEQVTQVTEQVTEITNPDTGLAAVVGDAEGGLVKDVADLGTEVDGLGTDIGNTESLATTSKEVVGAINEVEGRVDTAADQSALTSGLALKEDTANKSTSAEYATDIDSDVKFPTVKAVATAIEEATSDIATNTDYEQLKTTVEGKQDKLSGAQLNAVNSGITADKVSTYDGYAATIAAKANTADLGALATKDTVGTADIDAKAVTTEKLADGIVASLGKADTALQQASLSDYQTKTQADAAYAVKTLENQVGVVSADNMHTTASTVVTAIAEVADEAGAAQRAVTTAQGEVDALEAVVNNESTGLAAAHTAIDAVEGRVSTAETAIDAVESSVGEIQSDLAQMPTNTTIGTLGNLQTEVKTNLVGAINEVNTNADSAASAAAAADSKADAAQSAAEAAQETANAAIPKPAGSCAEPGATCVLVYNGTSYSWEDIARATEE